MPRHQGLFPDDDVLAQPPEIPARGGSLFPDVAPDPLAQTFGEALKQPPEQASRIFNLRVKTGLPPAVIERNLEAVEREVAQQGFDPARFRRESPLLARWLEEHPELAAIAQDDLAPLSAIERSLQIGARAVRALTTGPMAISAGAWGIVRAGAEWAGAEELSEFARGSAAVADYLRNRLRGDRAGAGGFESSVYGGLESLSLTATALPAAGVGGAAAVIAVLGGVTAGESFTRAREKGRGLGTATLFALGQGVIEAATEFIPARWFLADLATNATFWRALKHQAFAEVPGEQIATVLQDLNEWAVLRPEASFMDYLQERPSAAGETLVATIVAVGGQGALIRGLERMSGTPATEQVVQQLHESAAASKTRERAPEALRAFLELATKEGLTHVYTPAASFTEYFQKQGEDPAALAAELTGDPDALRLARATNGDLAIPTATYVSRIVGSGHEQFFANELRLSPDMQNARETREAIAGEAERVVAAPELDPTAPARQQIYDAMVGKLTATNRYTPREVDVLARLYETVFGALAGRRRVDPFALFQRYAPTLVAEGRPSDTAVDIDTGAGPGGIPASVARAGETPAQRDARRGGHLEALTAVLTREAQQLDPNVDPAVIREELDRRLALHEEGQATTRESGTGQDLLRAIAGYGGVWWERRSGAFKGEIEFFAKESRDIRGVTRGGRVKHQPGRATWRGVPGVFSEEGLTPDGMVEALRQDQRFQHITDINELLTAIDEAMQSEPDVDTLPGTAELRELGIVPGTRWWAAGEEVLAEEARYGPLQQPAAPPNDRGETAYFIGWQESGEEDLAPIPLYNVIGGDRSGGTLAPGQLDELGIPYLPPPEGDVSFNVEQLEDGGTEFFQSAPREARRAWLERRIVEARAEGREDLEAFRLLHDLRDEEAEERAAAAESIEVVEPVEPDQTMPTPPEAEALAADARERLAQVPPRRRRATEFEQGPGPFGTFNPTTRTIRLLKNANRTTFIHESAHLFLEVMADLAVAPDATPQLQADMQTLFDQLFQFEGDLAAWRGLTQEQRRAHHETFARGFEKYLGEGKAPTPELLSLFARFSVWIRGVYTRLRRLHVELSPDVRAVMDRLVATDEAIAMAEADAGVVALFTDAAAAGVPAAEFEGYRDQLEAASAQAQARLQARVLRELEREEEAWWQEEREALRAQVAAEVHERPVYRALAAMRGTRPDGSPLPEGTPATPLSKDFLVAQFGRSILRRLPRPVVYSVESGLPPDTVAQLFGYEHGEALIGAILAAPPMEEAIDALTDERMLDKHGDVLRDPDRLVAQAREAVAGEHRDAVIRTELAMLQRLRAAAAPTVRAATVQQRAEQRAGERAGAERLRTEMPDQATLERLAKTQIAGMRLRDIRPDRFFAAARRHSRTATQTAAQQKFEAAVAAKQQELVNLALYREALAARQAVDDAREAFAKMFTPDAPLAKRRNMEYVQAARAIAARFFWPERRLEDAREALKRVKQYTPGDVYDFLEERVSTAVSLAPDLASLTYVDFQLMRETVDALWERSLRDQQMIVDGERVDRNEVVAALNRRHDELGTAPSQFFRTDTERKLDLLNLRAGMRRVEHWVDHLDGGDPDGVFRRYLWTPISEVADAYRVRRVEYRQKFLDLVKSIEQTLVPGTIAAPELGYTFESKAHLLGALQHIGNPSNYQKLIRGYQWGGLRADETVDDTRWRAFLQRAFREGLVTKADMDFVQGLWNLHEELKPEAQRAFRDMYGTYFSEITAAPVHTPWGTYPGGYVPAVADPLRVARQDVSNEQHALTEGADNGFMFPTSRPGFVKERSEAYAKPLDLNLARAPGHLDKVLRFIHIAPRVHDVGRLLWTHAMRDRMDAYDPKAVKDLLLPWLQRAYSQRVSQPGKFPAVDKIFRALRTRTGLNIMAGNVINTLEQLTGLSPALLKVKPRHLRNALWRYVTDRKRMVEFIHSSDPMMATRIHAAVMQIERVTEDLLLNPSKYDRLRAFTNAHGYVLQTGTQSIVDHVVWGGAYEQASEAGADHRDAVRQAASAVRETQGSYAPEDQSRFEVQTPFARAFTMFSGWFNTMANLNATEIAIIRRDVGLKKGAGRLFYIYLFGIAGLAAVADALRQSLGGWDADDDEFWIDDAAWFFFASTGRFLTAWVPGAGPVVNYAADKAIRRLLPERATRYDDRISTSPIVSALEGVGRAFVSVPSAIFGEGRARTAVRDFLDLLGLATGIPVGAIKRPAGYLADVVEGREEPESALEAARGLISGRSQAER